jgi:YVTN family beta-propeller protein
VDFKGNSVTTLNRVTLDSATTIDSPAATHFTLAPDGKTMYVRNWTANIVSVIDANATVMIKVIPVGKRPNHLTLSGPMKRTLSTMGQLCSKKMLSLA